MAVFFIDTSSGHVATQHQLVEAGVAPADGLPPRPWLRIQGSGDATTMWYSVMRRQERGIFIGTLVFRHSPHHSLLGEHGWEEIPVSEITAPAPAADYPRQAPGLPRQKPASPPRRATRR